MKNAKTRVEIVTFKTAINEGRPAAAGLLRVVVYPLHDHTYYYGLQSATHNLSLSVQMCKTIKNNAAEILCFHGVQLR